MEKERTTEQIILLIEKIDDGIRAWINRLIKEEASFKIARLVSFKSELVGQFIDGLKICNVEAVLEIDFDDIILRCENYSEISNRLINEFGIQEDKISKHTSLFYLPESPNTGSISFNENVQTGCWTDINYLLNEHLIHYQNDLEKFYFEAEHRLIDKWLHYFEIYDRLFSKYREKKIKMLEIGVSKGGSLQMWKNYFGEDAIIVGVDIDPKCKDFEEKNILVEIGSQEDRKFLHGLIEKYGQFDIVLDDGGHTMKQQITTFEELYPAVNFGGCYLCEDCHTSYWRGYNGGVRKRGTFIEYMKEKIDDLNSQHIEAVYEIIGSKVRNPQILISVLEHTPKFLLHFLGIFNIGFKSAKITKDQIWTIQFYDSIVAIEKRRIGKSFNIALLK